MKYFFDTEFIEGFHKPLFGKRRHFIDLISIGIVAEDGREYYAISTEFNPKDADPWVIENVINKLEQRATSMYDSPRLRQNCLLYKSNEQIKADIIKFVANDDYKQFGKGNDAEFVDRGIRHGWNWGKPEFYAYYADYDWVVFCSLFGRMIDLPKGFPMYCLDLKQVLDDFALSTNGQMLACLGEPAMARFDDVNKVPLELALKQIKKGIGYPKQQNEHNALEDAKWNFQLYKFLNQVS